MMKLVGCLHAYRAKHSEADARLLTHDAGPMATAKMLSLPFVVIPENWLIPPESSDQDREKRRLESELTRLKKAEPIYRILCIDDKGNEIDTLESEYVLYEPLAVDEVAKLKDELRSSCPLVTDFGSSEPAEREPSTPLFISGMKEVYTPASKEEISNYKDERYPSWLERCEGIFRNLHSVLQQRAGQPSFGFGALNEGSRPGKDALVTLTAKGSFQIRPPDRNDDDDQDDSESLKTTMLTLPRSPKPPQGSWSSSFGGSRSSSFSALKAIKSLERQVNPFTATGSVDPMDIRVPLINPSDFQRDPNSFYYKPNRPITLNRPGFAGGSFS